MAFSEKVIYLSEHHSEGTYDRMLLNRGSTPIASADCACFRSAAPFARRASWEYSTVSVHVHIRHVARREE